MDKIIYKRVFEVTELNNRKKLAISEDSYLCVCGCNPYEISIKEFDNIKTDEKIFAIYLRMFNRMPDAGALMQYDMIKEKYNEEMAVFVLLHNVVNSVEFVQTGKKVVDAYLIRNKMITSGFYYEFVKMRIHGVLCKFRAIIHCKLVEPVWIRMPNSLKNFVRVICGRNKK